MALSPSDQALLDAIAARREDLVGRAIGWCAVNSGSRNLPGLAEQRAQLADAFAALPGQIEQAPLAPTVEIDGQGRETRLEHPPAIRLQVRPDAPVQVVLTGHYDTVFPADTGFREVRTRDDGALNGPGIADMKGGLSVMLGALEAFEAHGPLERLGYRVLISPDEELGSPASAALLAELGRHGHVGMTYEPALGDGALAAARKASGNFHVLVTGRAAHAGRDFAAGRNAVAAAARIGAALDAINGRTEGVTLNLAKIEGGAPSNVVPDVAVVRFNCRAPDEASQGWAQGEIAHALDAGRGDGIGIRVLGGFTRPPKPFNTAQRRLFEAVRETGALIGQEVAWKASGGVCEGNNLFAAGLPNADSLGVRGGDIHSTGEFAWPDSFVERTRLSALILMRLARGEIDGPGLRAAMAAGA
jgi:glutamate carboxypeptidase